jgi:hypothetical protein
MKRSKLFLGVTTCLLAVIGVAATKAHKFSQKLPGYFGTRSNTCGHISKQTFFTQAAVGSAQAVTNFGSEHAIAVYTSPGLGNSHTCSGKSLWVSGLSD